MSVGLPERPDLEEIVNLQLTVLLLHSQVCDVANFFPHARGHGGRLELNCASLLDGGGISLDRLLRGVRVHCSGGKVAGLVEMAGLADSRVSTEMKKRLVMPTSYAAGRPVLL